jgi:hypothetical protein
MEKFECGLNAICESIDFKFNCLDEYMRYFIETRYIKKTVKVVEIIKVPFTEGCKRYLEKEVDLPFAVSIKNESYIKDNELIWDEELLVYKEVEILDFKAQRFEDIMAYVDQYKISLSQFKQIINKSIENVFK